MQSTNIIADDSLAYFKISTVTTSKNIGAQAPGAVIPPGTTRILITCETQAVRIRDDGTAPTATTGWPIAVGTTFEYTAKQMGQLAVIEQTPSAVVHVWCFGVRSAAG